MIRLSVINSEVEIWKSIVKNFTQYRAIEEMAFYMGEGADHVYHPDKIFAKEVYDYPKVLQLLAGILNQHKNAKVAVVSLGCGSCEKDRFIMERLQELGHHIPFFGVDSSMAMLHKARKALHGVTFEADLIFADFGDFGFNTALDQITGHYDMRIYLFIGNTICSLNQGYIADILRNVLHTGDYLLLDVAGFETITPPIQKKLSERYKGYLENPADRTFCLGPIKLLGIPEDCGQLTLDIKKDRTTEAEEFVFGFQVTNAVRFTLEGEEVSLSRNEYIYLHGILIYDLNKLIEFLEGKDFSLKDRIPGDFHHQLLLQKQ